jgi:hypothetical protein
MWLRRRALKVYHAVPSPITLLSAEALSAQLRDAVAVHPGYRFIPCYPAVFKENEEVGRINRTLSPPRRGGPLSSLTNQKKDPSHRERVFLGRPSRFPLFNSIHTPWKKVNLLILGPFHFRFRRPERPSETDGIPPTLTIAVEGKTSEDRGSCTEKARLRQEYDKAVSEWSHLTEKFEKSAGKFAEKSKELREAAIKAKAAYEDHKSSHGC